ncbi:ATPase synthesis protein 25 mitochondrial [Lecanicillium sp. MT-2017a]|nr:ATPase synthesis protein 25 mitochondrial [Lecanicillium sp. MT-2017a]
MAFSCCGCRRAIVRAVTGAAPQTLALGNLVQSARVPLQSRIPRNFSTTQNRRADDSERKALNDEAKSNAKDESQNDDTPWFLEEEPPRHPPSQHLQPLPTIPEDAPAMLEPMLKYVFEDMGLDDLSLLDLRELDSPAALGPNLIMLFGTARSERHLHISAGRFVRWLRKNHKIDARADGLIGPGELRTKLRRLRKKAKLMGTNASVIPRGDNGISTGWICVNFSAEDGLTGTSASFDDSGRMSGFGASETGTTVVVQCMTESRRHELDLETLWQGILKRSIQQQQKLRGESMSPEELSSTLSSKIQRPGNPSALQWRALQDAAQQRRHFSTSLRRMAASGAHQKQKTAAPAQPDTNTLNLDAVRSHIEDLQLTGAPLNEETLMQLIRALFSAGPNDPETGSSRIATLDQFLLSAQERGLPVWSGKVLVTIIESIALSPAYGPELERAQRNLELLLTERRAAPSTDEQLRLMFAYAQRQDWERLWDTFRLPARYQESRTKQHYELVYRAIAATGDAKLCVDMLRWVYPEMLAEQPPVLLVDSIYQPLKACILIADPAAEQLLHNPPAPDTLDLIGQRKLQQREFVRVLREVEALHGQLRSEAAQRERADTVEQMSGIEGHMA